MTMKMKCISENPKLSKEWHPSKNEGLSPNALTTGSNKKIWWICDKGHEFEQVVHKRTSGRNCPYCANKKVLIGYNDLKTLFPKLEVEFDDEINDFHSHEVVIGSAKKAAWNCSRCGYKWITEIRHRTQRNTGCPKCAALSRAKKRQQTIVANNGALINPLLVQEWDFEKNAPLTPHEVTAGSNRSVYWICSKCEYKWRAKISNRAILGRSCPCCSNKVVVKEKNDLATTHPELAKEWHPTKNGLLTPCDVSHGKGKKVWWQCRFGHEYQATILHRSYGTNCPICNTGRQTSFAEQAIFFYVKKIFPDAINRYTDIFDNRMELDIFIPSIKVAIEYDGVFWHRKEISLKREKIKYKTCQNESIKLIRIKESVTRLNLFELAADEVFHIDNMEKSKEFNMLIRHLLDKLDPKSNMWTKKDPLYFHSKVDIDVERDNYEIRKYMGNIKHSLADFRPDLLQEWHSEKNGTLIPTKVSAGSGIKVWWKCNECGHEWKTSIYHRTKNGTGCNMCYRKMNCEKHPLAKIIYQYTLNGEFIQEWKSISEASRQLSISNFNISMCAKHQRKHAGGFRWEYRHVELL